ncbi:effector-associated constant component EACC1 [Streptomyces sp. L7]
MHPVTLSLSVTGSEGSDSNALRHLRDRLVSPTGDPAHLHSSGARPTAGTLGGEVVEVLVVLLPASLPVVGSVVKSWINARKGSVTVAVRQDDGTETLVIELRQGMSTFKPADLTELVRQARVNPSADTPAELPGAPDTAPQAPNTEPSEEAAEIKF